MAYNFKKKNFDIIRGEVVDINKVDKATKGMLEMLMVQGHSKVVDKVLPKNLKKFKVFSSKLWVLVVPNNHNERIPVLMAHTDTVGNTPVRGFTYVQDNPNAICNKDLRNIGGDDRLGCWIIQQLLETEDDRFAYILFDQEEVGCVGSYDFTKSKSMEYIEKIASCFIGLDRKGSNELALYGYESDEFNDLLEKIEGYETDFGSISDCAVLAEEVGICCVNMSIGYYKEHTQNEYIVPSETLRTLDAVVNLPQEFWGKKYEADLKASYYAYYENYTYYGNYGGLYKTSPKSHSISPQALEDILCDGCGFMTHVDDIVFAESGMGYCLNCVETNTEVGHEVIYCDSCGAPMYASESAFDVYGDCVCTNCFILSQDSENGTYFPLDGVFPVDKKEAQQLLAKVQSQIWKNIHNSTYDGGVLLDYQILLQICVKDKMTENEWDSYLQIEELYRD